MGHIEAPPKPTSPTVLDLFIEDARDWCRGRMWIPRALLLLVLVYRPQETRFLEETGFWRLRAGRTLRALPFPMSSKMV